MRRALFAREFRSALVPNLVTVGAILGALVALEKLYGLRLGAPEDVRLFIDITLLAFLVVSGLISGERCFPAELKESRIFFLSSLPVSRTWTWLAIVSARLLAALASIAFAVVLRRPLLVFPYSGNRLWWGIALTLSAYMLFFSAGTLFALVFRRTFVSYVGGFILLGILLIQTFFSSSYATLWPMLAVLSRAPTPTDLPPEPSLPVFLSLLMLSSFLLSWRFFVQGEIGNSKRRIRNQFLFGITITTYLGFVFCTASSTKLASAWRTWKPFDMEWIATYKTLFGDSPYGVSPNGKYLFVFESLSGRPFMFRVNIVDTQTGRVTYRSVYAGARWGYWSSQGDILNLIVLNNSPLDRWGYLTHGTADWIRLSPEGQEISKLRLKGLEEATILAGGRALAVLREGDLARINLLDGTSGQSSEMVQALLDGNVVVREEGTATLVYFDNVLLPRKAWIIDSLAREVRASRSAPETTIYTSYGETLKSTAEAQAAMRQRFPPPLAPGGAPIQGRFLLHSYDQIYGTASRPNANAVYFLDERAPGAEVLWARSTAPGGRWEKLPAPSYQNFPDLTDFSSGISSFFTGYNDARRLLIYDPQLGAFFAEENCDSRSRPYLTVDRVLGLKGILIGLTCMNKSFRGPTRYFEYLPGSGKLRTVKTIPAQSRYWPSFLYLDERGWEIWMPDYEQTEIWRSYPGTKDLRLWPAR